MEHYEIAAYGSAIAFAELLGLDSIAKILKQTLSEEAATDKKLTMLAESTINVEASNGGGETEKEEELAEAA